MGGCCSAEQDGGSNHELSQWSPLNFVNDEAWIRKPERQVSQVHFVAVTRLQTGGDHWNMYLQVGNESVRIDMEPGAWPGPFGQGYLGRLDISHQMDPITRNCEHRITVPARPGVAAMHFITAIVNADNHRYEFTQAGRGCTGWMGDQYLLFVQQGLLQPGYERQVEEAMNQEWDGGRATRSWPATSGYYLRDLNRSRRRRR